jgi:hypothetical protein
MPVWGDTSCIYVLGSSFIFSAGPDIASSRV